MEVEAEFASSDKKKLVSFIFFFYIALTGKKIPGVIQPFYI
jgi:hypothetical protein